MGAVKYSAPYRHCPLLSLIFKKVQAMTGGRLKMGISGGGPISADVQDFIRTVFGMPLVQGYALTETCMAGTVQHPSDFRNGVVGAPLGSVELYLNSCKEALDRNGKPYLNTDKVHHDGSACAGRGEVWIRGPAVSLGYYATGDQRQTLLEKTAAEFDREAGPPESHLCGSTLVTLECSRQMVPSSLSIDSRIWSSSRAANTSLWSRWKLFSAHQSL